VVADAKMVDIFSANNCRGLTNKMVYTRHIDLLPAPKIELVAGFPMTDVWERVNSPSLTYGMRELLFLLIHKKLPVKERLYSINLANSEALQVNEVCDVEHYFCSCLRVSAAWSCLKSVNMNLVNANISDRSLLTLNFPKSAFTNEVTWIMGAYTHYVWSSIQVEGTGSIERKKLFGYLKFKYKACQIGSRLPLNLQCDVFD